MLNEMRYGRLTPASIAAFKNLNRPILYGDGIAATELFPRREDVDRSNDSRLHSLATNGWTYTAIDGGTVTDPQQRQKLLNNFLAVPQLMLKENCQVMLIKNYDETLVNGSMGIVVGFCHPMLYVTDAKGKWDEDAKAPILDGEGVDDDDIRADRMKKLLAAKMAEGTRPNPVVRFSVPGGGLRDMCVEMDTFKNELPNGEVQVSRMQVRCAGV